MNRTPPTDRSTDGLHLERGLADVARDEIGPRDLDEVAAADQADAAVQPGDDPRDRRLARARVAREHDVQARAHLGECLGAPFGIEQVDREQPPDRGLDLGQADQGVELGQDRLGRLGDDHGRRPGRRRGPRSRLRSSRRPCRCPRSRAWRARPDPRTCRLRQPRRHRPAPAASRGRGPRPSRRPRRRSWPARPRPRRSRSVSPRPGRPGSRNALQVAIGTSAGASSSRTRTRPQSTCRSSTWGCEYALAIAIASSRTRSRITRTGPCSACPRTGRGRSRRGHPPSTGPPRRPSSARQGRGSHP